MGYAIWHRNTRLGRDEIDLIAFDPHDGTLVFAEVKTRRQASSYQPSLSLTTQKRRCMRRAAEAWIALHRYDGPWRIDTLCVVGTQCEHWLACQCPELQSA